jgi:hypothetical protein
MEYNITTINEIVHINNIVNYKYIQEINKNILSIDYNILENKINNIKYQCFDHINSFDDLNKLKVVDFINFLIDNRYDLKNIIKLKNNKNISDIQFKNLLNFKDIRSWFNYYSIIAIISKSLAQKK